MKQSDSLTIKLEYLRSLMIFIVTIYSFNEFYINEVEIPPPPVLQRHMAITSCTRMFAKLYSENRKYAFQKKKNNCFILS